MGKPRGKRYEGLVLRKVDKKAALFKPLFLYLNGKFKAERWNKHAQRRISAILDSSGNVVVRYVYIGAYGIGTATGILLNKGINRLLKRLGVSF